MEQITNKPVRRRRSIQEILDLLDEFEKTGAGVKEFCSLHNISNAGFYKWQSRYRNKTEASMKRAGFADLHIIAPATGTHAALFAEVKGIKIFQPVSASYLKELLQ